MRTRLMPRDNHSHASRWAIAAYLDPHSSTGAVLHYLQSCDALAWATLSLDIPTNPGRLPGSAIYGNISPCTATAVSNARPNHMLVRLRKLRMWRALMKNAIPSANGTARTNNQREERKESPQLHT